MAFDDARPMRGHQLAHQRHAQVRMAAKDGRLLRRVMIFVRISRAGSAPPRVQESRCAIGDHSAA